MYVAPFSLSSFSVSHLHPSLPTYLYVHFSTLESFKLSSTWAFAYIRTYPCACIPCIRACLRTRTTRSFPNSGESTYHRLFIYQPSSAFSTINPIILDRYFLFLLSFFFSFLPNLAPVSFRSFSSTYLFFHEFYRDHDSSAFRWPINFNHDRLSFRQTCCLRWIKKTNKQYTELNRVSRKDKSIGIK